MMLAVERVLLSPGSARNRERRWYPADTGAEVLAEYWLQTLDPHLIAVVKADHIAQLWPTLLAWDDVFEFTVYPAVTAAEGLEVLKKMPPK
jgi:hypothetical protein